MDHACGLGRFRALLGLDGIESDNVVLRKRGAQHPVLRVLSPPPSLISTFSQCREAVPRFDTHGQSSKVAEGPSSEEVRPEWSSQEKAQKVICLSVRVYKSGGQITHTSYYRLKRRSCQEVCKEKSGGSLPGSFLDSHSVDVCGAVVHLLHQLRGVQSPEPLLRDHQHLPDDRCVVAHLLEPFRRVGLQPEGGEGRFDRVARAQVRPVRLGELVEGEHPLPVQVEDRPGFLQSLLSTII